MLVSSVRKYTAFHDFMTKIMWVPLCKTTTHIHQLRQRFFVGVRDPSISKAVWIKYVNFLYFMNIHV
jgi:hypothetical protein